MNKEPVTLGQNNICISLIWLSTINAFKQEMLLNSSILNRTFETWTENGMWVTSSLRGHKYISQRNPAFHDRASAINL